MSERGSPPHGEPGLGIRHLEQRRGHSRRHDSLFARARPEGPERRANGNDRRRGERRRKRMQTLFLAAATVAIPSAIKSRPILFPGVSVAMHDFRALPPEQAYNDLIKEAALLYNLDEHLIRSVMRAESSFNPLVVSPAGAQGLMQIMPALARELGVTDPFDPRQNIMAGARYLRQLLDSHAGNIRLALASYNAGPGNVARYKGVPPFRETRDYVRKITGYLAEATE